MLQMMMGGRVYETGDFKKAMDSQLLSFGEYEAERARF